LTTRSDSENDYQVHAFLEILVPGRRQRVIAPLLLALAASGLGACATTIPAPSEADATRASLQWPGTTVAALARGRSTYLDRCTSCHSAHRPDTQPAHAWPRIVEEMATRCKMDQGSTEDVIRYLVATARR
jgi:cytochrome c5